MKSVVKYLFGFVKTTKVLLIFEDKIYHYKHAGEFDNICSAGFIDLTSSPPEPFGKSSSINIGTRFIDIDDIETILMGEFYLRDDGVFTNIEQRGKKINGADIYRFINTGEI